MLANLFGMLAAVSVAGDLPATNVPFAVEPPEGEHAWFDDGGFPEIQLPPPSDEGLWAEGVPESGKLERADWAGPTGEQRAPFQTRLHWMPQQAVKGQSADWAVYGEEVEIGFPLRIDPDGIWLALAGVQRLSIESNAVLPNSGLPAPERFWDIELGTMRILKWDNGWQGGGMFRVGSPSDRPFGAWRDLSVTLLAFLTVPAQAQDAWNLSIFYSPTSQLAFPIPGLAYVWRPTDALEAKLGIPFSVDYRPTASLALTATYMPLNNVQVRLQKAVADSWSVYGGYRTLSETYFFSERLVDRERTFLFDQRLSVGLEREFRGGWTLDLSASYVFDRQFFQAEKFSAPRRDELSIDSGFAGMLQLQWTR